MKRFICYENAVTMLQNAHEEQADQLGKGLKVFPTGSEKYGMIENIQKMPENRD